MTSHLLDVDVLLLCRKYWIQQTGILELSTMQIRFVEYYTKSNNLKSTYALINSYYTGQISVDNISDELDKISISNNFDIIIKDNENVAIYMSNKETFYQA